MTKIGAGTMVLSGTAISFNGNVTVSAGTLVAYNAVARTAWASPAATDRSIPIPTSAPANVLTINAGAVLEMYGDTTSAWYTSGNFNDGASISLGTTGATMADRQRRLPEDGRRRLVALRRPQLRQPRNAWTDDPRARAAERSGSP